MIFDSLRHLFPTTVLSGNIDREFTQEEKSFFEEVKKFGVRKNEGNANSIQTNVLDSVEMDSLKQNILESVKKYFDDVICPINEYDYRIVLSWMNWTEDNQYHHEHWHLNSFLSGVLYINAEEQDSITFYNPEIQIKRWMYEIETNKFNPTNSKSWWIPVKTGDIVIFPSWLHHSVETRIPAKSERVSLAFNIVPKGIVGSIDKLTRLEV